MRSKPVASLLVDLDITKSHSRPYTSDDKPYSEAQFKMLKYRPDSPSAFAHSKMHAPSAKPSSLGTTISTDTVALPT